MLILILVDDLISKAKNQLISKVGYRWCWVSMFCKSFDVEWFDWERSSDVGYWFELCIGVVILISKDWSFALGHRLEWEELKSEANNSILESMV